MINFFRCLWFLGMVSSTIYNVECGKFGAATILFFASFVPFIGDIISDLKKR